MPAIPTLSRRTALAGLGAAGAAGALTVPAAPKLAVAAETPLVQAPGFFRFRMGDLTLTVVSDGVAILPSTRWLGVNVPEAELLAELEAWHIADGPISVQLNTLMVEGGGRRVLLEAGGSREVQPTTGQATAHMRAAGIEPASIDRVAISHGHPDHCWAVWNEEANAPRFANATYAMPEVEWDFWTDEAKLTTGQGRIPALVQKARDNLLPVEDKTDRIAMDGEIAPGIRAIPAAGHTPGHIGFLVTSGDQSLMCLADSVIGSGPALAHPDWHWNTDLDKDQAVETRKRLLDMAATDRLLVHGYHFAFPGVGHIARTGQGGYRFIPLDYSWTL